MNKYSKFAFGKNSLEIVYFLNKREKFLKMCAFQTLRSGADPRPRIHREKIIFFVKPFVRASQGHVGIFKFKFPAALSFTSILLGYRGSGCILGGWHSWQKQSFFGSLSIFLAKAFITVRVSRFAIFFFFFLPAVYSVFFIIRVHVEYRTLLLVRHYIRVSRTLVIQSMLYVEYCVYFVRNN